MAIHAAGYLFLVMSATYSVLVLILLTRGEKRLGKRLAFSSAIVFVFAAFDTFFRGVLGIEWPDPTMIGVSTIVGAAKVIVLVWFAVEIFLWLSAPEDFEED